MTGRYVPNGTPLTWYEDEILTVLIEECAEVIQAATKLQRFGKENRPDKEAVSNTEALGLECGDAQYMLQKVIRIGLISPADLHAGMRRKFERFRKYSQHMPDEERCE